jgi:hypothetical protein
MFFFLAGVSAAVAASTATAKAEPKKSLYTNEVNKKARNLRKLLVSAKSLFAPFHRPWGGSFWPKCLPFL